MTPEVAAKQIGKLNLLELQSLNKELKRQIDKLSEDTVPQA